MKDLIFFIAMSSVIILVSSHVITKPTSHGFYRFFAWEGIAWLFAHNFRYWFSNPLSVYQIVSWCLLIYASILAIWGFVYMQIRGKAKLSRKDSSLYGFEKTTALIDTGIFHYVRHPLYGSLLFLAWGICLKNITLPLLIVCIASSIFLFITMLIEQQENIRYFGDEYKNYIKRSKMIIPFLL